MRLADFSSPSRRAGQSREPGLPRREPERAVGHGHHRVQDPGGQGVPVAGHRLLRRHAGRLDDRHEPQRRIGQRDARVYCFNVCWAGSAVFFRSVG